MRRFSFAPSFCLFQAFSFSSHCLCWALAPQASFRNLEVAYRVGLCAVFDAFSQRYCHCIAHFNALRPIWKLDMAFRRICKDSMILEITQKSAQ